MQIISRLSPEDLIIGRYCTYKPRTPDKPCETFIEGRITHLEMSTRREVTLVTFVSTIDRKTYIVSPFNLYY